MRVIVRVERVKARRYCGIYENIYMVQGRMSGLVCVDMFASTCT